MKGFTTIHAGSGRQALSRLRFICQLAETSSEVPMAALNNLVSESIDVVVHCSREPDGPRVTEIISVEDQAAGFESTQFTVTDLFRRPRIGGQLQWTGELPVRAARAFEAAGYDLPDLLGAPARPVRDPATNRVPDTVQPADHQAVERTHDDLHGVPAPQQR